MDNFEKRDIVEMCAELGIELNENPYSAKPYLNGCCPFHDEINPSFVVFPLVKRWICYGCTPEGGDVIDLVMRYKGIGFVEAKKIATSPITDEEAFQRSLIAPAANDFDTEYLQIRAASVFDDPRRFDFSNGHALLERFDTMMVEGRYFEADKFLRVCGL